MSEHAGRYDHFAKWLNKRVLRLFIGSRGRGKTAGDISKVGFLRLIKDGIKWLMT